MGARTFSAVWDQGVSILNTVRDAVTNTIVAILGDEDGDVTESNEALWVQHIGFASRPSKPVKGQGGPQATILRSGDRDVCIGSRDPRCHPLYASLNYGEFCVYAPGENATGQARVFGKADGSVLLYTRVGNDPGGAGMTFQLDATNNVATMLNGLGFGVIADASGVTITTGAAGLKLGADGSISMVGTAQVQVDGTTVLLGSQAVPLVNAALHGPTGISGAPSLKVLIE